MCQTRIAIECKRYARTVGIDKVEAFATKLADLRVDQGVMVSATGFNPGAKASARDNRITLLTYREASALDWAEVTKSGSWLSFIVSRRNVRSVEAETPNGHRVLSEGAQIFPEPGVVLSISDVVQGVLHDLKLPERPGEYTIGVDALGAQRATDNGLSVDVSGFRLVCQVRSFEYIVNLTLAGGHVLADSQNRGRRPHREGAAMTSKSRTVVAPHQDESPLRHLPLVDLLVDTRTELLELASRSGLKVFTTMLEQDRELICGPRYAHEPDRPASRAGTTRSEVVLGGRKVAIQRPRARTAGGEVPLPTFQAMAKTDPLDRRVVEQMLVGVATRQYARSLEPLDATMESRGTSKSSVSRRLVARTQAQLEAWQAKPLDDLALAVRLLDGVHIGEHCLIVALGITEDGTKHALGLWEGSTENSTMCQSLLANLQSRGLRTDHSLLVILDGSKALRKAVREMFSEAALVQRCQIHKLRNVLDHLPDRQRPWVKAILQRAYRSDDVATGKRLLQDLARRLDAEYPSAAESVREGLDETLTIIGLGLSPSLRRSLSTTNAAESLISRTRHVKRNVKRWRTGRMVVRWAAAGVLEAVKGFRRLKGHKEMPKLVAALRARDQQLGLVTQDVEKVA